MTSHSLTFIARRRLSLRTLALALLLGIPLLARADVDTDADGLPDATDACPASEPSDLVKPDGCAICSCDDGPDGGGWASHGAYVACVSEWVRDARRSGSVTATDARLIVRRARKSTCGTDTIRCCVFRLFDDEIGHCRFVAEEACDALDDRLFDTDGAADIEDTGSCIPNPCTF